MAEQNVSEKSRLGWPDVLRAVAVYFIALGHTCGYAGALYPFVYTFHVQLLFFLSGLFASRRMNSRPGAFLLSLVNRLLIPFLSLCVLNASFFTLYNRLSASEFLRLLLQCLAGRRNNIDYAAGLWFFPCLIVMTLLYRLLAAAVKNRKLRFALCFLLSFTARCFFEEPFLLWSANCAVIYLVYYAAGDLLMPLLGGETDARPVQKPGLCRILLFAACAAAALLTLLGFSARAAEHLGLYGGQLFRFLLPFPIIYAFIPPARFAARSRALCAVGQATLILSATEQISSALLYACGLSALLPLPGGAIVFAALCVTVSYFIFALPLRRLLPFLFSRRSDSTKLSGK